MSLPTFGGVVTRGEVYAELCEHLIRVQELMAVMGHLHNTEDNHMDKLLAQGWLGMSELIKRVNHGVAELARGRLN